MRTISRRTNIQFIPFGNNGVVIYEDHRTILKVLRHAINRNVIPSPVNIICFDRHDDFEKPLLDSAIINKLKANPSDEAFFDHIVEWKLASNDQDWIQTGMLCGIINDFLLIGSEYSDNIKNVNGVFRDTDNNLHKVFTIDHLWNEIIEEEEKTCAPLIDSPINYFFKSSYVSNLLKLKPNSPYVLDFDLDCFTVNAGGPTARPLRKEKSGHIIKFPGKVLKNLFTRPWGRDGISAQAVLKEIVSQASLITIARESPWCGGFQNSGKILSLLDRLFFNNALDSIPSYTL